MLEPIAALLFAAAAVGLVATAVQCLSLWRHVGRGTRRTSFAPPVSILKPLCGVDDALEANLESFARLAYPSYEVVLGVRSPRDAAWPVACQAARRWPDRFRVAIQLGEPGLNPKVNQLVTLARAARHELLVVSDSNVRVHPGYLSEIAALLEDPQVGLVTHPVAGVGEATLGALLDQLQITTGITPGIVATKELLGRDIVVGKSMALRRADLRAFGGFEAVKDFLAEDYVMGVRIPEVLGKRVAYASSPVLNVTQRRTLREFVSRYCRWSVLQRQTVGPAYALELLLNPILLATAGAAVAHDLRGVTGLAATCLLKVALDALSAQAIRPEPFRLTQLAMVPLKDLLLGWAWAYGLVRRDVAWRGTRLTVQRGTRIAPETAEDGLGSAERPASA
jgi:ceramide glucosyltransferase